MNSAPDSSQRGIEETVAAHPCQHENAGQHDGALVAEAVGQDAGQQGGDEEAQEFPEEDVAAGAVADLQVGKDGGQGGAFKVIGEAKGEEGQETTGSQQEDGGFGGSLHNSFTG